MFAADGFKLPDEVEAEIEQRMEAIARGAVPCGRRPSGSARPCASTTPSGRYVAVPEARLPQGAARWTACKVVVDCANGAAYQVAPQVFEELGAEVVELGVWPDGRNINDGCGALHPENMAERGAARRARSWASRSTATPIG